MILLLLISTIASNALTLARGKSIMYCILGLAGLIFSGIFIAENIYVPPLSTEYYISGGLFDINILTIGFNLFIIRMTFFILSFIIYISLYFYVLAYNYLHHMFIGYTSKKGNIQSIIQNIGFNIIIFFLLLFSMKLPFFFLCKYLNLKFLYSIIVMVCILISILIRKLFKKEDIESVDFVKPVIIFILIRLIYICLNFYGFIYLNEYEVIVNAGFIFYTFRDIYSDSVRFNFTGPGNVNILNPVPETDSWIGGGAHTNTLRRIMDNPDSMSHQPVAKKLAWHMKPDIHGHRHKHAPDNISSLDKQYLRMMCERMDPTFLTSNRRLLNTIKTREYLENHP